MEFLPSREIPPIAVARRPQDVGMIILRVKVTGVLQQVLDVNCSACFYCVTCQIACPPWVPLFPPVHDLLKSAGTIKFYDCLPACYQGRGYPGGDSVTVFSKHWQEFTQAQHFQARARPELRPSLQGQDDCLRPGDTGCLTCGPGARRLP